MDTMEFSDEFAELLLAGIRAGHTHLYSLVVRDSNTGEEFITTCTAVRGRVNWFNVMDELTEEYGPDRNISRIIPLCEIGAMIQRPHGG
jgi:hypothetical protein